MLINQKIEFWKNRLLDLGKKNRLINCSMPKTEKRTSRAAILIYKPSPVDLWNTLSEGETILKFPVPIDTLDDEKENQQLLTQDVSFINGILTNQSPKETCKTLRSLMKKSKEFTEEKGLNALYLAFGFLYWKENGIEGQEMRSPLILVPVTLSQDSLSAPIILSRSDDEIIVNRALEQKLLNDFGITLPPFDEADDWQNYLSQVRNLCSQLNWRVECDAVQMSLFSFLKINMYRDFERNADKIASHSIVRTLNGESYENSIDLSEICNYNHDMTELQDVYSVLDADSSQLDAIMLAKRGVSFVLQGPPGTGKSQTITNIISELIAIGKKVLFVSEKVAALEVVYKRLKQTELDSYCLTLHSHKAKRREILDQLDVSLKLSRNKAQLQKDAYNKLFQLREIRSELNTYSKELHTIVEPLGKSIYEVNGILASYTNYKNIDYIQLGSETFTPELLAQCESSLEEIARIVYKSGYQQNNPWTGCIISNVTHEFRQQFLSDSYRLLTLIDKGVMIYDNIITITGASNMLPSVDEFKNVIAMSTIIEKVPNIPFNWLQLDLKEYFKDVDVCANLLNKIINLGDFVNNLDQYTESLLAAISNLTDCIFVEDIGKIQSCISNYISTSEIIKTLIPNEEMVANISKLHKFFDICQEFYFKYKQIECEKNQACVFLNNLNQLLDNETKILDQRLNEWQEAEKSLVEDFDDKIMSFDISNILSRYRNEYRSGIKRFFSSSYKIDRKTLFSYYKKSSKMTYTEALSFLNRIYSAQNAKVNYFKQEEIVNKLSFSKKEKENEIATLDRNMTSLNDLIHINKNKFDDEKHILIKALEEFGQNYHEKLENDNKIFNECCENLALSLGIIIAKNTNFDELKEKIEWAIRLHDEIKKYSISSEFAKRICDRV